MKEVLDALARIPGVRTAVLATEDGVPIAVCSGGKAMPVSAQQGLRGPQGESVHSVEEFSSLSALALAWMSEVGRSIAPLSWEKPHRVVLRAARGTLVMLHAKYSILMVVIDHGARPEDLRLPMDGAVRRMERILRSMGDRPKSAPPHDRQGEGTATAHGSDPAGPIPTRDGGSGDSVLRLDTTPSNDPGGTGQH